MMRFDPSTYRGLIAEPFGLRVAVGDQEAWRARRLEPWSGMLTPVDDQGRWGTCEAQSTTRILETLIQRDTGKRVQLSAEAVYRAAWEATNGKWPGDSGYSTGLVPGASFRACVRIGVLPSEATRVVASSITPSELERLLTHSPILCGTAVTGAWKTPRFGTGEIQPLYSPLDNSGGHAWVGHGLDVGGNGEPLLLAVNSWGTDWGYHGFFQMITRFYAQTALALPFAMSVERGWFDKDRTWEKYVSCKGAL